LVIEMFITSIPTTETTGKPKYYIYATYEFPTEEDRIVILSLMTAGKYIKHDGSFDYGRVITRKDYCVRKYTSASF
ncbi:MAG: hypothetical protein ACTSUE_11760, partial [Promethearchaeota archaeon]